MIMRKQKTYSSVSMAAASSERSLTPSRAASI